MDTITERNWGGHVLSFIIKGITDYKEKNKKAIDGCLFALMIIYFQFSKNKDKKMAERPPKSWIANWSKEQLVERMRVEIEENIASSTSSSGTEKTDSDSSTSESETQEDLEDSPRKQPSKKGKRTQFKKKKVVVEHSSPEEDQSYHGYSTLFEIGSEDLDEFLRENNENSTAQGEKEADMRSTEGHYVSSETIPDVNLGSDDPSSQGHTTQSSVNKLADSIMSLVEESHSEPADLNMMVMRKETSFEALAIVPIQVCLPVSQTTAVPEFEEIPETKYEPTSLLQIEGTTKTNPAPEDTAALMMMARTSSYVPKKDSLPSFSLGFTDSSQEETTTQEGASTQDEHVAKTPETPTLLEQLENLVHKIASGGVTKEEKSPQIPKESAAESFEKFETPVRPNLDTTDMKQKCYHWAIRVKSYLNERTNEFDDIGKLQAGDIYTLSKFHLASLAPKMHIEAEVSRRSILSPPDIVNMAIVNHPKGVFLNAKTNRPFRVEDYLMFIPFLNLKKLASHRYVNFCTCRLDHWWLWIADTRKKKFYIVDPVHNKSPTEERTVLNTFVVRIRNIIKKYMLGGTSEFKGQGQGNCSTIPSHLGYDCAIYVMKWLEIFEPANIKRRKYEWDNWTQDEVDHFRVEYAFRILFHDLNLDKHEAIRGSNAIRVSKPSSLLLSPYCQIDSEDVELLNVIDS
ncbi:hypothetical protein Ahy_A01g001742 isoform A [Arachis hypogaea]|uniref:Ubiquitin-like protease family profile domain-containing protein n=1 Tax=Arachis hypogaea TaxID=3818 RepID=A0A445EPB3_ARAHY|nr:hypothetical protein Ahy_A01g001742 isoform A [Arachis hypogaea]